MPTNQESNWNLQELGDAEICAAIRYLDPYGVSDANRERRNAPAVICASLSVLLVGCVALIWLYCRVRG